MAAHHRTYAVNCKIKLKFFRITTFADAGAPHIDLIRNGLSGFAMYQNETERHVEMNNLDQRMRDAYKDSQSIKSKSEAARAQRANFALACVLAVLVGLLLAIFF